MVRSAIALNLGNAYWASGGVVEAAEHYEMAAGAGEDSAYVTLTALSNLAAVEETRGRLDRAAQISRRAMALGEEWGGGQALPAAGRAYIGLGRVLYLQNDLSGAETEVEHGVRMGQQAGDTFMEFEGRRELARLRRAQGRQDALEELLNWTRENAQRLGRVTETAEIDALRAELLLARSDLLAAARWISERKGLMAGDLPFSGYPRQLVMARVLYALEREAEALQLLGRMRQEAESRGRAGHVIAILGLEALCQRRTRLVEDSLRSLERALRLAEAENHVRLFIDHGPPMIALLEEAAERKIMRAYCEKLVAAFRVDALPACGGSDARLVGPLSRREIEVLRMLAGQLSGPEIAEKLFVALSTLRTHTKTIYAKLAVGSRRAAVHRARELRLL
jgi:LuxR family maltose regulon positive regulatory protein